MRTTVGQILVNEALPPDLRDYQRELNKKSIMVLMTAIQQRYPHRYAEITKALHDVGSDVATGYGGSMSVSLSDLRTEKPIKTYIANLNRQLKAITNNTDLTRKQRNDQTIILMGKNIGNLQKLNLDEGIKTGNSFALQAKSGSKGNQAQFGSLRVGDLLVMDHRDKPIPIPMLRGYAAGLDPVEYWAGSYGARRGLASARLSVAKAGFLGKQLANASHRLVVTEKDCGTTAGIPVGVGDSDNEGSLLAKAYGEVERNTVLTPKIMRSLKKNKEVYVRSPLTCQAKVGVCQKCAGVRERGELPKIGDNIGMSAANAVAEPIAQGQLSSRHTGGLVGTDQTISGFDLINQLVQVPKTFKGAAALSTADGTITRIEDAPQGGKYIYVGSEQHYVPVNAAVKVRLNEKVEAGDVLSAGIPNPALVIKYKGIGAGRVNLVRQLMEAFKDNGTPAHRRNVEAIVRGLVNHVRVNDLDGPNDSLPGDVMEFDSMVRTYEPRFGSQTIRPKKAVGMFLEKPILQYSIGTRITPSVATNIEKNKVSSVLAHVEEPSFEPDMQRAMDTLSYADDWMVRLGGFHLKKGLLGATHKAQTSRRHSESYIPSLAEATEFGKVPAGGY